MKHLLIAVIFWGITNILYSQVQQLVYLNSGLEFRIYLVKQSEDSIYYTLPGAHKKEPPVSILKGEVIRTQTLEVHFIHDEYNQYLANKKRGLDFGKLANNTDYGVHISGRQIGEDIVILIKLKFGNDSDLKKTGLILSDGELIDLITLIGDTITIPLHEPYMLKGHVLYNFCYINLSADDIKRLTSGPLASIIMAGRKCKMSDEYCLMRHIFALIEEEGFY